MDDFEGQRKPRVQSLIVDLFHCLYYHCPDTWPRNTFLGYPIEQCPFDLHLYQELVARQRPSFILQTGVMHGGSVLYFACLLDLIGASPSAVVVGIDKCRPRSRRRSSSPHPAYRGKFDRPANRRGGPGGLPPGRGMVVLDSDHREAHVLAELRIYREFVGQGNTWSPRTPTSTGTLCWRTSVGAPARPSAGSWTKIVSSSGMTLCGSGSSSRSISMDG